MVDEKAAEASVPLALPTDMAGSVWRKIWIGFLKCFRGLVAEPKGEHGWELSKGSVAFWIILTHCMFVWNKIDPTSAGAEKMDVSQGELYTLWALVGYAGVKVGSEMVKSFKSPAAGTQDAG